MDIDEITGVIIDAALKIHRGLGPGLLESVYEAVLARDLVRRGLVVERQRSVSFEFDGMFFTDGLRVDLLVCGCVVVELKSVERFAPVHGKQLLTYLRLMNLPVGLLINFGGATLKEGLHRVVNNYTPDPSASTRLRVSPSSSDTEAGSPESNAPRSRSARDLSRVASLGGSAIPAVLPRAAPGRSSSATPPVLPGGSAGQ